MSKETIEKCAAELGLTLKAVFVPWSQSRNAGEKRPSLNWSITLHKGSQRLTTDYMAGSGHCPSYKQGTLMVHEADMIRRECETGQSRIRPIAPELADVLHSLASDADVIHYPGFEQWAADTGYDADSRKAESIYRACLATALKLRAMLGNEGLERLREACRDY